MRGKPVYFEIGLLFVCSFYFFNSLKLDYGTLAAPGPGFLPVVLGFLGTLISVCLLIGAFMSPKKSGGESGPAGEAAGVARYRPMILYIITLAALIAFFEALGTIPALLVATVIFSKICGLKGWLKPLILGAATSATLYAVFAGIFDIQMPGGILSSIL